MIRTQLNGVILAEQGFEVIGHGSPFHVYRLRRLFPSIGEAICEMRQNE